VILEEFVDDFMGDPHLPPAFVQAVHGGLLPLVVLHLQSQHFGLDAEVQILGDKDGVPSLFLEV